MDPSHAYDGVASLTHLGVIRARGADAAKFLQSQLTNDVETLRQDEARLAGFCSAKGRLQASFLVWRAGPDEFLLACAADLLAATLKRLSMFVLRAQCKLSDASGELTLWGQAAASLPELPNAAAPWSCHAVAGRTAIVLPPAAGTERALWVGDAPAGTPMPLDAWRWLELQSGVPLVEAATVDRFVPQMINFELLRGVDFRKGCYPGQEVVARSQYRGTIKRRMFAFDVVGAALPAQEVFVETDPSQPAGIVVNAAPRPDGPGSSALVEVKLAVLASGQRLRLGSADGAVLRPTALPYEVPVDAPEASGTPAVA
jgi:folate-binding protein YgfZ